MTKQNEIKYVCHEEGFLWGQTSKSRGVISNYKSAINQVTDITILIFLQKAILQFDPKDSTKARPYFLAIFVSYIAKEVLSILDVAYILCINYKNRQNSMIIASVITNIALYSVQLLAVYPIGWVRENIVFIDIGFAFIYLAISVVSSSTDPAPPQQIEGNSLSNPEVWALATESYCRTRFTTYLFLEGPYLIRALGTFTNSWLIWTLSFLLCCTFGLIILAIVVLAVVYVAIQDKKPIILISILIVLVVILLFTPKVLFIFSLDEFEKSGKNKSLMEWMIWLEFALTFCEAISSIRIKRFIADDDLRIAEANRRERSRRPASGALEQNQGNHLRRIESIARNVPIVGYHLTRYGTGSLLG